MPSPVPIRRRVTRSLGAVVLGPLLLGLGSCSVVPSAADPSAPAPASPRTPASDAPTAASSSGSPTASGSATPTSPSTGGCTDLVSRLSLAERVGQLLMVAVTSTGLTDEQATAVGATDAGSVVLRGNSTVGAAAVRVVVSDGRGAAGGPQHVRLLVAADQEGGLVQRLQGDGFADIPSASRQAGLSDAALATQARSWGQQLDSAGVNADLAPVADVVPRDLVSVNEPIGRLERGYGSSPDRVAGKVGSFTAGMDDAGIATAVKHFPGLGRVIGNTDTARRVVDRTTTRDDAGLAGFAAAVDAKVDMVMVSSAIYSKIDAGRQAVFSPTVVDGMIRGDLGFDGVVISDDLAAAAVQDVTPARRAVAFVQAGGDLAIVGDPAEAQTMATALLEKAQRDPAFADRVGASANRVLTMKQRRGLAGC